MSDMARTRAILNQIDDLTHEMATLCGDLDEGDVVTDVIVIAGVVNPADHSSGALYYTRPETPSYTLRGLVQVTAEDMAAVSVANVVSDTGWDEGETDGE